MLCTLIDVLSGAHTKGGGGRGGGGVGGGMLNDFKFGTFIGRFPSMAVKRLIISPPTPSPHTPPPHLLPVPNQPYGFCGR